MRIEMFGDEIERLMTLHPVTGEVLTEDSGAVRLPGQLTTWPVPSAWSARSRRIESELEERLAELERQNKLLEAQRLRMRTEYDLEMMRAGRLVRGNRELLPPHRRPRAGQRRRTACSTTSRRTSCWSSTSPT